MRQKKKKGVKKNKDQALTEEERQKMEALGQLPPSELNESIYSYYTEATDRGDILNDSAANLESAALDMDAAPADKQMLASE